MRAEAVSTDSAKSKIAAGVTNESLGAESGRNNVPRRVIAKDGSTLSGRSRIADSDVPMDYNMEQGGDSAEPHEATADHLGGPSLAAGLAELISPVRDLMDSRLEIIDFGRRLSEESLRSDASYAVPQGDIGHKSEKADDEEPQWESTIVDSSDSSDDLDLLRIAHGSDVESGCDREQTSDVESLNGDDAGLLIDDSVDTIFPQPSAAAVLSEQTYVVADDFLDVEMVDELNSPDEKGAADSVQNADDEIDPDLQSFLKRF